MRCVFRLENCPNQLFWASKCLPETSEVYYA